MAKSTKPLAKPDPESSYYGNSESLLCSNVDVYRTQHDRVSIDITLHGRTVKNYNLPLMDRRAAYEKSKRIMQDMLPEGEARTSLLRNLEITHIPLESTDVELLFYNREVVLSLESLSSEKIIASLRGNELVGKMPDGSCKSRFAPIFNYTRDSFDPQIRTLLKEQGIEQKEPRLVELLDNFPKYIELLHLSEGPTEQKVREEILRNSKDSIEEAFNRKSNRRRGIRLKRAQDKSKK